MNQNKEPSFLDTRTLLAVVLVGATFIGWQTYMQKKYPQAFAKKDATATATVPEATTGPQAATKSASDTAPATSPNKFPAEIDPSLKRLEQVVRYESANLSFVISSDGMGLKDVHILSYKDRVGQVIQVAKPTPDSAIPFQTQLLGQNEGLFFKIEKVNDNMFVGRAQVGGVQITKTLEIDPAKYLLDFKIAATGADDKFIGLTNVLSDEAHKPKDAITHLPQYQLQELFIESADKTERSKFTDADVQQTWSRVKMASIGSHYFTQIYLDKSDIIPEAKAKIDHAKQTAEIQLQYSVLNKGQDFNLNYQGFVGPKSFKFLESVNPEFAKVVDFGFFNWIARHLLELLIWFHAMINNWGWAIIALTILVRICVMPFNIYSYKSMKSMQAIQPQIQALREKYKDDQAKQQSEMMALMKSNKVNPVGGCLPVFFQIPIFIALYQVLGNSIELYQAPFALWIQDLSLKDPFYILPVLMGVTMFVQQKITPNTMDPAQAKVMLMLPLIFIFFMATLPSGLTLYMWVSAVFGVLQQMYFLRKHGPSTPPVAHKK